MVQFHCFARATTIDDQMTTVPIPVPGSEFNNFLFASIGEDRNGMLVSVLSGLARSDVDPWQEAAKLAQLPGETATRELAALIGALPDRASAYPDPRTIAARLIALLPRSPGFNDSPQQTLRSAGAMLKSRPWWIYVGFMCFLLGSQFLIANHQLPAKSDKVEMKSGSASFPPAPPVNSGQ
jgi:hypothetical protein